MKKAIIPLTVIIVVVLLSIGIVDAISALTDDINSHLWLNIIGRWQSRENSYREMEFHQDGTFVEYYYGVKKGSGEFLVNGNRILLNYDSSSCPRGAGDSCSTYLMLKFEIKNIILENSERRISFYKVGS
jgi:hypothetical protein